MDLEKYVRVYDDALDVNTCRAIIDQSSKIKWERWNRDGRPQFDQFNVTGEAEIPPMNGPWTKIHNEMILSIRKYTNQYMEDVGCVDQWPMENALEQLRLKRYKVGENDRFEWHADVGDHSSARRFLAMFYYLNDVEKGGETEFSHTKVKPVQGRVLMFPPMWMFPHAGLAPVSNDKYIIGTYLHYV
tara:strand:+ start:9710 stop:10270 length:561 start_codon:yes stop_codon:yes gene_type:complete